MARIRTLKPDWLENERLASCSDAARLLSVSLILLADDYGNGRAAEGFLLGRIWLYSDELGGAREKLRRALAELQVAPVGVEPFLVLYLVGRQRYFSIPGWKRHQFVQHPGRPQVPGPEKGEILPAGSQAQLQLLEGIQSSSGACPEPVTTDLDLDLSGRICPEGSGSHTSPSPTPQRLSGSSPTSPAVGSADVCVGPGRKTSSKGSAAAITARLVERFNAAFERSLSPRGWVRLVEELLAKGYSEAQMEAVIWWAAATYGEDASQRKRVTPRTFLKLESGDGSKTFPENLALAEELWREEEGSEPFWLAQGSKPKNGVHTRGAQP